MVDKEFDKEYSGKDKMVHSTNRGEIDALGLIIVY